MTEGEGMTSPLFTCANYSLCAKMTTPSKNSYEPHHTNLVEKTIQKKKGFLAYNETFSAVTVS